MVLIKDLVSSNFKIAVLLTGLFSTILFVFSYLLGNIHFFLFLNCDLGNSFDTFFLLVTQLGETIPWVLALILILLFKRKSIWVLVAAFSISTFFVQGIKNLLPEQPRPTKAIENLNLVHTVKGVDLHKVFSFPSGHTATAFTIFFLSCLFIKNRLVIPLGFIYAILVGYSRIYLAQHFPRDVAGGMLVAIITIYLSLLITKKSYQKDLL